MITKETYNDYLASYIDQYAPVVGTNGINRMVLIVLLCGITQEIRKGAPETAVIDVVNKIAPDADQYLLEWLLQISMHCEGFLTNTDEPFPHFGFETLQDKVKKIKQIINDWMPF